MAYDKETTFNSIILSIEEGSSLRATLLREGMPDSKTFYSWIDNDELKSVHYARACEKRAEVIFEDILTIADDSHGDKKYTETGEVMDAEYVARSRIRIDARKWMLSKMQPKKYGDKTDITSGGEKIKSNEIKIEIVRPDASDDSI
jgi:hypothetical protein